MTKAEAEKYVRDCSETEGPETEAELHEIFRTLYGRNPDTDEDADIWSLCCAAVEG